MSNLTVRVISAAAMIIVIYGCLTASFVSRWGIIAVLLAIGAWEFARMLDIKYAGPKTAWLAGAIVFALCIPHYPGFARSDSAFHAYSSLSAAWAWGLMILSVAAFTLIGFRFVDIAGMAPWIYLQIAGCAYFGIYASALFDLLLPRAGWRGIFPLLMIQIAIACADTGAYFTGRKFGKRKLAPSISSGKTVEGAYGGTALTVLVTALLGPKLLHTGLAENLGLGLVLAFSGIIGDLFISILKRHSGVKDSSHIIPGHGGILDRFDSFIFSAPIALFYLRLVTG